MKVLNLYLPRDIINIILDYLQNPDIVALNKEYHEKFEYDIIYNYLFYKSKGIPITSREPKHKYVIRSFITGYLRFYIPLTYAYSLVVLKCV